MKVISIYMRKSTKKNVKKSGLWTAKILNEETGEIKQTSLKTLSDFLKTPYPCSKTEATIIASKAIEQGFSPFNEIDDTPILSTYLENFWDYEHSDYLKTITAMNKNSITKGTAIKNLAIIRQHIIESNYNTKDETGNIIGYYLPSDLKVTELSVEHIDKLQKSLLLIKHLNPKTVDNIFSALSTPLNNLVRKRIIPFNPIKSMIKASSNSRLTSRDAFTEEEVEKLCLYILDNLDKMNGSVWIKQAFLIITAPATGMRYGELTALQPKNIHMIEGTNFAGIYVERTYTDHDGFKLPKNGKPRWTYCDKRLAKVLLLMQENPEALIFAGEDSPNKPIGDGPFHRRFTKMLKDLNIEREDKDLVFHSLRHYTNTKINDLGYPDIANAILGHSSSSMNDRYNHSTIKTVESYAKQCGSLIPETILARLETIENKLPSVKRK